MSAPGLAVSSLPSSLPSSASNTPPSQDRPERSRNAKAQARHRAKRKAYIEQLEQTVTKLQTALGFSPEQVAALPPPLAKIRELEAENARLVEENERLKRLLGQDPGVVTRTRSSNSLTNGVSGYDGRCTGPTNDYGITKRRRSSGDMDPTYDTTAGGTVNPGGPGPTDMLGRAAPVPPPLTIPHSQQQHQYTHTPTHTPHSAHPHSSMFSLHHQQQQQQHQQQHQHQQGAFTIPSTPSSSTTSSPPFSPATTSANSPNPGIRYTGAPNGSYPGVKVEDESYGHSTGGYTLPPFNHHNSDSWYHSHSREGVVVHR